jgi:hypothetical protein
MFAHSFQSRLVIPAFVEGFKDMPKLFFGEPVEARHDRIEFGNHVLLLAVLKRATLNADGLRPGREPLVRARQPTGERDHETQIGLHCAGLAPRYRATEAPVR